MRWQSFELACLGRCTPQDKGAQGAYAIHLVSLGGGRLRDEVILCSQEDSQCTYSGADRILGFLDVGLAGMRVGNYRKTWTAAATIGKLLTSSMYVARLGSGTACSRPQTPQDCSTCLISVRIAIKDEWGSKIPSPCMVDAVHLS